MHECQYLNKEGILWPQKLYTPTRAGRASWARTSLSQAPLIVIKWRYDCKRIKNPRLRLPRTLKRLGGHSGVRTGSHHLCGGGRSKTSDIEFWLQLYDVLLIKLQRTQTLTASTEKSASCSSKASINQQSINQLGSLQCRQHNNNHASPSVKLCNKDAI